MDSISDYEVYIGDAGKHGGGEWNNGPLFNHTGGSNYLKLLDNPIWLILIFSVLITGIIFLIVYFIKEYKKRSYRKLRR